MKDRIPASSLATSSTLVLALYLLGGCEVPPQAPLAGPSENAGGSGGGKAGAGGTGKTPGTGGKAGSGMAGRGGTPGAGGAPPVDVDAGEDPVTVDAAMGTVDAAPVDPGPSSGSGEPPELPTPAPTDLPKHRYKKVIKLDTSATGANVTADVAKYPVAVLLSATNFDFAQAQPQGRDLRFSTPEGMPLPYSIELWDAAGKQAALWVKVDVKGNSNAQSILMHWGNPEAGSAASSKSVFDMADGFVGVFHLNQDGSTTPQGYKDASSHGVHGTGVLMAPGSLAPARIGKGTHLDNPGGQGKNQYIAVDDPKANMAFNPTGHAVTASAWAWADSFGGYYETVMSKGDHSWTIQRDYQGRMEACQRVPGYHSCAITAKPQTKVWVHYAIIQTPGNLAFFVNGKRVASAGGNVQTSLDPFFIGAQSESLNKTREWHGTLDEVRVMGVAKDPAWLQLDFESQKEGSKFLSFGETQMK